MASQPINSYKPYSKVVILEAPDALLLGQPFAVPAPITPSPRQKIGSCCRKLLLQMEVTFPMHALRCVERSAALGGQNNSGRAR